MIAWPFWTKMRGEYAKDRHFDQTFVSWVVEIDIEVACRRTLVNVEIRSFGSRTSLDPTT